MIRFLNKNAFRLLIVWIIILSLLYSTLSILRHNHFQSGGFDLGLYDQAAWQYSRFLTPHNTIKERHILGDHLTLTLPLLASLFWLWDNVRILLIFQAFWISLSTLAIFKLCRIRGLTPLASLNLSFIYSLFPGIQFAVFFDFHPVVIGAGLIAWLIYFLEAKKKKLFFITLILLILTQENMGIAMICLGIIYFFQKSYRKWSIVFILIGSIWSFVAIKIITLFSSAGFQYWPKFPPHPLLLLKSFFNSEEKRLNWLYSFSWFSFIPLFSPSTTIAVIIDLSQYLVLAPRFSHMWGPWLHHRVILAPFLLLGVLEVLAKLKKYNFNLQNISFLMVALSLTLQYYFHFPLNKLSKKAYWREEPWMADNRNLINSIPKEASIATQQNLVPHLSHRKEIYLVWPRLHDFETKPCGQTSCWWLDFGGKPEYLAVDLRPNQWLTQILESNENFQSAVKNMEKEGKIKLEKEINFAKLYKINY